MNHDAESLKIAIEDLCEDYSKSSGYLVEAYVHDTVHHRETNNEIKHVEYDCKLTIKRN